MEVQKLCDIIGGEFYTGVPDSQLKALCDHLIAEYGISEKHIIAANEGNCVGLAAGYHLATGKTPVVYLQNSGLGNILNPAVSLLHKKVYGIPCIFLVGWRGEPGVKDEPQHVFQGEVTLQLLKDMDIDSYVVSADTTEARLEEKMKEFRKKLEAGKSVAFVFRKGALTRSSKLQYSNPFSMKREDIIGHIVEKAKDDIIVSTTGKASRELFEIRERRGEDHSHDFLTVGSMGHSSSIALGIALQKKERKIWCIDGDGACLMHMGSLAVIGANAPDNLIHIVINNCAHETVGGMPTVADKVRLAQIARGCGYPRVYEVDTKEQLMTVLDEVRNASQLCFVEIKAALGAREDLGRPTTTPQENKEVFQGEI